MFYSESLQSKKGPLARVWLAANLERKLSKSQFLQTSIPKSISSITQEPLALRLSGQLLLGVVRIYSRKARYLLEDCNDALLKIKMAFRPGNVDLPSTFHVAPQEALLLQETITELDLVGHRPDFILTGFQLPEPSQANLSQNINLTLRSPVEIGMTAPDEDPLANIPADDNFLDTLNEEMEVELGRDEQSHLSAREQYSDRIDLMDDQLVFDDDAFLASAMKLRADENPVTPARSDGHIATPQMSPAFQNFSEARIPTPPIEDNDVQLVAKRAKLSRKRKVVVDERVEMNKRSLSGLAQDTNPTLLTDPDYLYRNSTLMHLQQASSSGRLGRDAFCPPNTHADLAALLDLDNFKQMLGSKRKSVMLDDFDDRASKSSKIDENDSVHHATSPIGADQTSNQPQAYENEMDLPGFDEAPIMDEIAPAEVTRETPLPEELSTENVLGTTKSAVQALRRNLGGANQDAVNFADMTQGATKAGATKLFFEVLLLATRDAVKLKQAENFGHISISAKPNLLSSQFDEDVALEKELGFRGSSPISTA